jgi:hypothetical protein
MSVSYSRIWKKTWQGLDVGHRGLGTSFKLEVAELVSVTFVSSELHYIWVLNEKKELVWLVIMETLLL